MKLYEHNNSLATNVKNTTTEFGVGDVSVLIDILRNRLYENKIQTLVQEYICNARDAMREVKKGNKFEITVPTHLAPVFKVKDFGPGVSTERMANVFVLYGASTKRGTNNQTGGFGIGAKSAWSYTDSFTIVTTVDGIKRSYVAHTGVNKNGRLDLISEEETSESNGTEIQIAVKREDINEFRDAVLRATYFWKDKPTIHNCTVPQPHNAYRISSTADILTGSLPSYIHVGYDDHVAVIDGIPYLLEDKLINKCKSLEKFFRLVKGTVAIYLGNGVVEVSASRESIADSKTTVEALDHIAKKLQLEVTTMISTEFGKVKTPSEYIETYRKFIPNFYIDDGFTKYGAYTIKHTRIVGQPLLEVKVTEINSRSTRRSNKKKIFRKDMQPTERSISLDSFDRVYFLDKAESGISQNKRLREYFNTQSQMVLIEPLTTDAKDLKTLREVVKDLEIKDFQSLTIPVVPKEQRAKVIREKTEFCMHVLNGDRHKYTTLSDNQDKWLYVSLTDKGWDKDFSISDLKALHYYIFEKHGFKVCGLAERAIKMVESDSKFTPLKEWLETFKPKAAETAYAKSTKAKNGKVMELLRDVKGIEDKALLSIIKQYKTMKEDAAVVPDIILKLIMMEKEYKDFLKEDTDIEKLIKTEYPLLLELDDYYVKKCLDEVAFYINAKFNRK